MTIRYKHNGQVVDKLPDYPERLAEMLATQSAPRVSTDDTFFADHYWTVKKQMEIDPVGMSRTIRKAQAKGYIPNINDVYLPAIADEDGDPAAFISRTGGKTQIKRTAEAKNKDLEGAVTHKAREVEPVPDVPLSERLIKEAIPAARREHPKASAGELRDIVVRKHSPKFLKDEY